MDNSIGMYIHIPFCKAKCHYCDFNSYSGREHLAGPYFDALFSELVQRSPGLKDRKVGTVFIGGGTPSLVNPKYISDLLELCAKRYDLDPSAEISMESNPGTLTGESLKAYRSAGVNRLSIGLQAWQDKLLKDLGRIHDKRQFVDNFKAAVKAGFSNINVDLIFGLPGQGFEDWAETLEAVAGLGKDSALTHLSCYSLKIEDGTVFGDRYDAGTLKPADEELDRRMYRHTVEYLAETGFRQYEISNFARPGFECRHNLVYWKAREYAGFGAGAHSYLNRYRFSNITGIESYIGAVSGSIPNSPVHSTTDPLADLYEDMQFISEEDSMSEFLFLGLRLTDGISAKEFHARFGADLRERYGEKLNRLRERGLLSMDGDRFKLTGIGLDLANQVFVEFI